MMLLKTRLSPFLLLVLCLSFVGNPDGYFLKVTGNRPYGLTFDRKGFMYLMTAPPTGNGTLSRVTPDGKVINLAALEGTFIGPGIAVDDSGNIFVTVGNKLLEMSSDGKTKATLDGFSRCFDVKLDRSGNIYVADDGEGIVYKIDASNRKEMFYRSDSAGSFKLTGICFDSGCKNLFVRDGKKLLKFHLTSDGVSEGPQVILENVDMFYICIDSSDNLYASTLKNVIRIDSRGRVENLSREDLKTSIGLVIGCKGFDEGKLYVAVEDGIAELPIENNRIK